MNFSTLQQTTDNKMIEELRDELKDLSKTIKESNKQTRKFTIIIIFLAFIQFFVAFFQLIFAIQEASNKPIAYLGFITVVMLIIWTFLEFRKIK